MQNKKLYLILAIVFVAVVAAAFVAGRLLNGGVGPLGFMPMMGGDGGHFAVSISITPAPELPTAPAEVTGIFVSRQDNTITVQSIPMNAEGGGAVTFSASDGGDAAAGTEGLSFSPADMGSGPKVEVVVTGKTIIYRDATLMSFDGPPGDGQNTAIQQTVEAGSLDDLSSQTMVTIWGRKNGDRIIADIIMYSVPIMFKKP